MQQRSVSYWPLEADCNFATPKSREMPAAPHFCRYHAHFFNFCCPLLIAPVAIQPFRPLSSPLLVLPE